LKFINNPWLLAVRGSISRYKLVSTVVPTDALVCSLFNTRGVCRNGSHVFCYERETLMPEFVQYSKRILPHIQLEDSVLFISWRLAFTLPKHIIDAIRERNISANTEEISPNETNATDQDKVKSAIDKFYHYDSLLDKLKPAGIDLSKNTYRAILSYSLFFDNKIKYDLYAFCIMTNHVHIVIKPLIKDADKHYSITEIMRTLKSTTAHKINTVRNSKGKVWMTESYDHIVKDEKELINILNYVINNPVKSGMIERWEDWEGTYLDKRFLAK